MSDFKPGEFAEYGDLIHLSDRYAVKPRADLFSLLPSRKFNSLLEVGCANGANLKFFSEQLGIQPSQVVGVDVCQGEDRVDLDFQFFHSSLESYLANSDRRFDLILLSDVLEHIYNPWRALGALKSLLNPGGLLLVSVPNIENLNYVLAVATGKFAYTSTGLFDETHIRFFSLETLAMSLEQHGYQVVAAAFRPDQSLTSARSSVERILENNTVAQLDLGAGISMTVDKGSVDRKFGQQVLICASAL